MPQSKDLYNQPRANLQSSKPLSSSTSLSFNTTLSSLLSSSASSSTTTRGRPRPSKTSKSDIFSTHNKNTKKRALADLNDSDDDSFRKKIGRQDIGGVDPAVLSKSKRKLEEKSKKYRALKRGELIQREGEDGEALVDFDRMWAEKDARGSEDEDESDAEGNDNQEGGEEVEYEDEYGRLRRGTKKEAARMALKIQNKIIGAEELEKMSARPSMPTKLIYGDTIQHSAFSASAAMEELAAKRDRSATPPEKSHYEASKEIRSKGVGFYAFSGEEGKREEEMRNLEREREETERRRREMKERAEKRKKEVEDRRKVIGDLRAKRRADNFLEELGGLLGGGQKELKGETVGGAPRGSP